MASYTHATLESLFICFPFLVCDWLLSEFTLFYRQKKITVLKDIDGESKWILLNKYKVTFIVQKGKMKHSLNGS